jgi:hypothetical protein
LLIVKEKEVDCLEIRNARISIFVRLVTGERIPIHGIRSGYPHEANFPRIPGMTQIGLNCDLWLRSNGKWQRGKNMPPGPRGQGKPQRISPF